MTRVAWNKRTREEVGEIVNNLGYKFLDEYYKEGDKKHRRVVIQDSDGYKWDGSFDHLIDPNRQICFFESRNIYTLENIELWLSLNRTEYELCEGNVYINAKIKLTFFHNISECKEKFCMTWNNMLQGYGCNICSGIRVGEKTSLAYKRPDLASEWHPDNEKTPNQVVCGSHDKAYWICSKCGYGKNGEWLSLISSRTSGRGCPACTRQVVSDINRLSISFPDIASEWDYEKNSDTPEDVSYGTNKERWWRCPNGHNSYSALIGNRTNKGQGCPECSNYKGEDKILSWVENNILNLKKIGIIGCVPQKTFEDCRNKLPLRFDFGFEHKDDCWRVVEFYGGQHFYSVEFFGGKEQFKLQKKLDKIKQKYCEENNIPLLIIPYWEFDNIEKILTENLL